MERRIQRWALRAMAVATWLGLGVALAGVFASRPLHLGWPATALPVMFGLIWLLAPMAIGPSLWEATAPLPRDRRN